MKLSDVIHVRILCHFLVLSTSLRPQTSPTPVLPSCSAKPSWRRGKGGSLPVPINFISERTYWCRFCSATTGVGCGRSLLFTCSLRFAWRGLMAVESHSVFLTMSAFTVLCTCEHNLMTAVYHLAFVWQSLTCVFKKKGRKKNPSLSFLFIKMFFHLESA